MIDNALADTADVRHLRTFADPDAVVNDRSKMLYEMAVEVRENRAQFLIDGTSITASAARAERGA